MSIILRDTQLEVNLDNIAYNMKNLKELLGKDVSVSAVIKGNAYGHGAVGVAETLIKNGAESLAVATLDEALELRRKFKDYKIAILGYTPDRYLEYVVANNIVQTIFSYRQAKLLNDIGIKYGKAPVVHIKYDTGLNRIGFEDCLESIDEIVKIYNLKNLNVEGIFSHLALASREENEIQYQKFMRAIEHLEEFGINFKYKHIEDSISAVDYPEYRMNLIRAGALLFGIKVFHHGTMSIKQALTFKTRISRIKKISAGEGVSYDYLWRAERDSIIGTLPFGYADGYPRHLSNKGYVTIHGKKAPIVGLICMDQCMVDLTDIPEAQEGDEAIIYGDGTKNTPDLQTLSELAGTNKNELMSRISRRVPRVYISNGEVVNIINYLE